MDEAFIGECVKSYGPRLIAYARSLCGDSDAAKDAAQEAFIKLCALKDADMDGIQAWLYKVCRNNVFDALRKNSRMVSEENGFFNAVEDSADSPVDSAAKADSARAVLAEVSALPQGQRELLVLRYYSDMSYGEIAEVTGMPAGSVGVMISRALCALKEHMKRKGLQEYGS